MRTAVFERIEFTPGIAHEHVLATNLQNGRFPWLNIFAGDQMDKIGGGGFNADRYLSIPSLSGVTQASR
jgi:hypothetical protein